jgi:hypothetical protein
VVWQSLPCDYPRGVGSVRQARNERRRPWHEVTDGATEPLVSKSADLREARTRASCCMFCSSFANNEIEPTSTDHEDSVR